MTVSILSAAVWFVAIQSHNLDRNYLSSDEIAHPRTSEQFRLEQEKMECTEYNPNVQEIRGVRIYEDGSYSGGYKGDKLPATVFNAICTGEYKTTTYKGRQALQIETKYFIL